MTRLTRCLILAAAISACGDTTAPFPGGDPSGVYAYLARVAMVPVVQGRVTLVVVDDSIITGTWELQRVPSSDTGIAVGPQVGTGTLVGRRTASGLWLDMNPGWVDNNVLLTLLPETTDALAGTWNHSTIVGPVTGGSARLQRLQR